MNKSILRRLESRLPRLLAVVCVAAAALGARAQPADVEPPGRVARVVETLGQVWLYSPDTGEWISAARNRPLTSGDRLATDPAARVELAVGSTTLRLDGGSELEISRLDDEQVSLHLHGGSAAVRVRDPRAVGELELTTADGRVRVQREGRYRLDRLSRSTDLSVYAGEATYEGPGSALAVYPGQRVQFWIEPNGVAQYSPVEPLRDDFAAWNGARDAEEDRLAAVRYVSPEMTGAQELVRYGSWQQTAEYGPIWYPRAVPVGWAPYTTGHWAWVPPWGWTWVDDAPWGFAPFHYGRWVHYHNRWCWAPGRYVARPVYAPALVAWIGGSHASVSISIGGGPAVGWVPLAPHEVYVPAFRASPRWVREVNVTHVTNITNVTTIINNPPRDYANRHVPNAVTVVPESVLTRREPVAPAAARARDLPNVRQFVAAPPRATAMLAPPVAVPAPAHAPDARPPRPPGFAERAEQAPMHSPGEGRRTIPERPRPGSVEAQHAPVGATPSRGSPPEVAAPSRLSPPVGGGAAPAVAPAVGPVGRTVPPAASPARPPETPSSRGTGSAESDGRRTTMPVRGPSDEQARENRDGRGTTEAARAGGGGAPPSAQVAPPAPQVAPAPPRAAPPNPQGAPASPRAAAPTPGFPSPTPLAAPRAEAPPARPAEAPRVPLRPPEAARPAPAVAPHPPEGTRTMPKPPEAARTTPKPPEAARTTPKPPEAARTTPKPPETARPAPAVAPHPPEQRSHDKAETPAPREDPQRGQQSR